MFFFTQEAPSLARQINSATLATPLFRLTVYTKSDGHRVALSIHHALFDGISLPLILQFVEDELLGRSHSPMCSAEQLLEYVYSADTDAAREFWVAKFSGFDWSTQRSINLQPSSQIRRKAVPLATSLSTLSELLAPHEVTLQSALTCTFASLLAQHVRHNDDVAFGVCELPHSYNRFLMRITSGNPLWAAAPGRGNRTRDIPDINGASDSSMLEHKGLFATYSGRHFGSRAIRTVLFVAGTKMASARWRLVGHSVRSDCQG
jgi:hypothetical protein